MLRFFWTVTILLMLLAGGGYANYGRNAHLDAEFETRPYRTLSDSDLLLLEQANSKELAEYQRKVDLYARSVSNASHGGDSDLSGQIENFDRAQELSGGMRAMQRAKSEREIEIKQIAQERSIRQRGLDDPWVRFKRRLLTF